MALAIYRHRDPTIIGACGAFETGDTEIEIFYLVFEAHRGRGYATSAATALIGHLRSAHPDHDLAACIAPEHVRSNRILEELDFIDRGPRTVNEKPFRYLVRAAERPRS